MQKYTENENHKVSYVSTRTLFLSTTCVTCIKNHYYYHYYYTCDTCIKNKIFKEKDAIENSTIVGQKTLK